LRYFNFGYFAKRELLKYCHGIKGKDGIFGKFNRICIRNIIRFFAVGNPTISKQLIKKRNDKYPFHVNIFITSIINIQKQINKEIIINELRNGGK
jgi:hypothetical protein